MGRLKKRMSHREKERLYNTYIDRVFEEQAAQFRALDEGKEKEAAVRLEIMGKYCKKANEIYKG